MFMKFNDLDMNNWKNLGINVDSLQVYESRGRGEKHKNIYHGISYLKFQINLLGDIRNKGS
ncbi:Uncharacterised protein [Campylobacter hominis]|uniref:Uncharacterized protein n=2 Tax=Campylobacter hominis TaxID=76517 RepID=A7I256_CAMHC|nr:hypothetical protein CHAB381_1038 [Campylobacter hominis ATCC BAA-381]SUW85121.1 Uncharacterised protein [Campylobacter hominis]